MGGAIRVRHIHKLREDFGPYFCANTGGFSSLVQTGGISIRKKRPISAKFGNLQKLL
jgi:hypothetical protein